MISAVVLVNTELGAESEVLESLLHMKEVEEASVLYGVYDLVVKVKAQSLDELRDIIKLRFSKIMGVASLLTLMLVDPIRLEPILVHKTANLN